MATILGLAAVLHTSALAFRVLKWAGVAYLFYVAWATWLDDYEGGVLKSVTTKSALARLKAAARATATKDRRVNIRLSSGDLQDIQARALQEGLPCQTLTPTA